MSTITTGDIIVWPDGAWCYGFELWEMQHMGDDYRVLKDGMPEHEAFLDQREFDQEQPT